ncbi:hypothetical protein Pfo_016200 [Paulownia fortunei]|nr:hypothetical protein Pfo_016200 [Paulownia fortunei]
MDMNLKGVKIDASNNGLNSLESPKVVMIEESDGVDESQALLPSENGGLSKKSEKPKRKVQWLDKNGDKLAEILEFQPRYLRFFCSASNGLDSEEQCYCGRI